jgi:hypothetical protein
VVCGAVRTLILPTNESLHKARRGTRRVVTVESMAMAIGPADWNGGRAEVAVISAARGRPQPGPPAAQAPDRRARTPVPGRGHSSVGGPGRQRLPDRGRRSPERTRRPHVRAGGVTDGPDGAVPDEGGRGGAAPGFGNALDDRARGGVHRAVLRSDAADRAAFRPTPGVRSRREPDHLRLRAGRRRRGGSRARRSLLPRDRDRGGSLRR